MLIGIALGIVLAVMRLSPNPILSGGAWVYVWFFRAVPRVVLLILFGNLGVLYAQYDVGVPFDRQIGDLFGLSLDGRFFGVECQHDPHRRSSRRCWAWRCPRRAYMAEIVRAGISVDRRGPDRGGSGAGHVPWSADAPDRAAAGDARHRPADRQRDDRDAQGHVAGRVRARTTSCSSSCRASARGPSSCSRCWSRPASGTSAMTSVLDGGAALPRAPVRPGHSAQHRPGTNASFWCGPGCDCRATGGRDGRRPGVRAPDGQGRGRAQALRPARGPQGHRPRGACRARSCASSARPVRASRRSCAASTTWSRSTAAGCGWTVSWSATGSAATSCTSCARRRWPTSAGTSAWCSSASTSSRT